MSNSPMAVEADFATTWKLESWAVAKRDVEAEVERLGLHYDRDAGHPVIIRAKRVSVKYHQALHRFEEKVGKRIDVHVDVDVACLPGAERIDAWLDGRFYVGRTSTTPPCAVRRAPRPRAHRARRRTSSSSTTAGCDPGDPDPPRPPRVLHGTERRGS